MHLQFRRTLVYQLPANPSLLVAIKTLLRPINSRTDVRGRSSRQFCLSWTSGPSDGIDRPTFADSAFLFTRPSRQKEGREEEFNTQMDLCLASSRFYRGKLFALFINFNFLSLDHRWLCSDIRSDEATNNFSCS